MLTAHTASEGAHGFILNRPIGSTVADFLSGEEFGELADVPVHIGGPVQTEQLTFASISPHADQSRGVEFDSHLSTEMALRARTAGHHVIAFVGYSGWTGGQLEAELMQRAWIASRAKRSLVDLPLNDRLWRELLRSMGPWYQLLADMPPDPSLN